MTRKVYYGYINLILTENARYKLSKSGFQRSGPPRSSAISQIAIPLLDIRLHWVLERLSIYCAEHRKAQQKQSDPDGNGQR
jgi:hypothetical protein